MTIKNKTTTYIFSHIPKTGGTTLRVHFQKHLEDQEKFIHLAKKGEKWALEKGLPIYRERSLKSREKVKVILGHQVNYMTKNLIPNNKIKEVVFFRDPIAWEKSRFNQFVNKRVNEGKGIITFQQWIKTIEKTHSQFDWFLSNYLLLGAEVNKLSTTVKEKILFYILDNFSYICLLEQFKENTRILFKNLNIPNNPKKENVVGFQKKNFYIESNENEELINRICYNDILIFNKIKNIYEI